MFVGPGSRYLIIDTLRRATRHGFARRILPVQRGRVPYLAFGGTPITLTPAPRDASIAKTTSW